MVDLHTVFDITVGSNGIGGDAWFRMAIGIGTVIAGMVWVMRVWRKRAGWRRMFNAVSLIGFGAIWLIVYLPLWNLATSDTDRLFLIPLSGQSEVSEGTVHVIHMQPAHGHASGGSFYPVWNAGLHYLGAVIPHRRDWVESATIVGHQETFGSPKCVSVSSHSRHTVRCHG